MARTGGLGSPECVRGTDGIAENPANRRRERSTRYKRRGVIKPNRIGNHHGLSCKLWLAGPFPSLNSCSQGHASASFYRSIQKIVNKPVFHMMTLVTTACWLAEPSRNYKVSVINMLYSHRLRSCLIRRLPTLIRNDPQVRVTVTSNQSIGYNYFPISGVLSR